MKVIGKIDVGPQGEIKDIKKIVASLRKSHKRKVEGITKRLDTLTKRLNDTKRDIKEEKDKKDACIKKLIIEIETLQKAINEISLWKIIKQSCKTLLSRVKGDHCQR